jgi:hypothetical protein
MGCEGMLKIEPNIEFFFGKYTSQQNTKMITNLKALSLGLSGSSNFTALGWLIMALGIGTPGVQLVIVGWLSYKCTVSIASLLWHRRTKK